MWKLLILSFVLIAIPATPLSKLSENDIKKYTTGIVEKIITDNPDREDAIRRYCKGHLKRGKTTVRLDARLGLFYYQMSKKDIHLKKTRFYAINDDFTILLIMDDQVENRSYLVCLEYTYSDGKCVLKDLYVASIYEETLKEMRAFFDNR